MLGDRAGGMEKRKSALPFHPLSRRGSGGRLPRERQERSSRKAGGKESSRSPRFYDVACVLVIGYAVMNNNLRPKSLWREGLERVEGGTKSTNEEGARRNESRSHGIKCIVVGPVNRLVDTRYGYKHTRCCTSGIYRNIQIIDVTRVSPARDAFRASPLTVRAYSA